jgi:hypothetical protein
MLRQPRRIGSDAGYLGRIVDTDEQDAAVAYVDAPAGLMGTRGRVLLGGRNPLVGALRNPPVNGLA